MTEILGNLKVISRIKNNIKYIFNQFTLIVSIVFGVISGIQLFVGWESIGINNIKYKITALLAILVICGFFSLILGTFFSNKRTIYSKDEVEIEVKYGDLMEIAFPNKMRENRIVVIAVNCCFDMIVNQDLIRENSVHGQFIKRYAHDDIELSDLNNMIEKSLNEFDYNFIQLDRSDKRYGNLKRYPLEPVQNLFNMIRTKAMVII